MVSSFYSSGQQKLKVYTADRRIEEDNGNKQQAKVYAKIAQDRGDIETADRFAKLGMDILGKVAQTPVAITNKNSGVANMSVIDHIKSMIEAGSLSQWWEAIKKIPARNLSAKARIVQDDIKHNALLKEFINERLLLIKESTLTDLSPSFESKESFEQRAKYRFIKQTTYEQANKIIQELLDGITGGDTSVMQELDTKAGLVEDVQKADAIATTKSEVDIPSDDEVSRVLEQYSKHIPSNKKTPTLLDVQKQIVDAITIYENNGMNDTEMNKLAKIVKKYIDKQGFIDRFIAKKLNGFKYMMIKQQKIREQVRHILGMPPFEEIANS